MSLPRCLSRCFIGSFLLFAPHAFGFAEDVCYEGNGTLAKNCATLPASCATTEPVSNTCLNQVVASYATRPPVAGRSLVHADATYVMAQAVGFSATDAYWIAAYDEATDLGTFQPLDMHGQPVPGNYTTAAIDGLVRTNFDTGGVFLHFIAPRNSGAVVNGLHPDMDDPYTESTLAHLRAWALAGSTSHPQCTGGFTLGSNGDSATGSACYVSSSAQSVPVRGTLTAVNSVPVLITTSTGPQVVHTNVDGSVVTSAQLNQYLGGTASDVANARLGIYLHTLADRVSHHVCTDAASIVGPLARNEGFREDINNPECGQAVHLLRHLYETGVMFSSLSPQDQTTTAVLGEVWNELVQFASARGVLNPNATQSAYRNAIVGALNTALQEPSAPRRIARVNKVACDRGWELFPGATCSL
ncbi:hypothetical protein [Pyxidicoccus sp. MSG2]|uniref:hypothetical protein n=1 Tax=Pyxidicoccus sp. MSG2 TaxID=2996790 RepID=UPI00226E20F4|nr:hypothetical protein [Pyxidicoccus sp. MSG2]MCY1015053.1 hypothetical protein [Pyxidicoccus sp. MSG2]